MAKQERKGNRKKRENNKSFRKPELGYYLIVTDTEETERCYFNGLRDSLPKDIQDKLVIKVFKTNTKNLINECQELTSLDPQYRKPWIVFDRDKVKNFDEIIKEADSKRINVGWSNPCFEVWLYTYFGDMPAINDSWNYCSDFKTKYKKETSQEYSKADSDIYSKINKFGNEENAIKIAEQRHEQHLRNEKVKPSEMCPCTTVYELVKEVKSKIKD